jgi:rSAM/selenodomain-associated transferase 1
MALAFPDRGRPALLTAAGRRELLVFLKAPRVGAVKTRLAVSLGEGLAAEVYRKLARAVIQSTAPLGSAPFGRVLCYAPADGGPEVSNWFPGETTEPQAETELGGRMLQAFANAFDRGSELVVLIGTDCPSIDRATVETAFDTLARPDVDLLLRAAEDGGYTLIGLKAAHRGLFEGVAWSTPQVLEATLSQAANLGLRVRVEGPDRDIDTADDLRSCLERLKPQLGEDLHRRLAKAFSAPAA